MHEHYGTYETKAIALQFKTKYVSLIIILVSNWIVDTLETAIESTE